MTDEITEIKNAIIEALPVEKLFLFGSYAYGTPTEDSDYDFYVLITDTVLFDDCEELEVYVTETRYVIVQAISYPSRHFAKPPGVICH